jgi:UTP-glucose-1-phosphate uridylyltransferase
MGLRSKGKRLSCSGQKYFTNWCGICFYEQPEQLGLGHAVLCAERVVGNDPPLSILRTTSLPMMVAV